MGKKLNSSILNSREDLRKELANLAAEKGFSVQYEIFGNRVHLVSGADSIPFPSESDAIEHLKKL